MASFDSRIIVRVLLDALPVSRAVFTVPMIAGFETFAERFRSYASETEVAADTELTATMRAALNTAFSQSLKPATVIAGKLDTFAAQVETVTVDTAADGEDYTVTLDGVDYTFTAPGASTPEAIIDGLVAALAGATGVVVADLGASLSITASDAGVPFVVSVTATTPANISTVATTPNTGVAEGLDAIRAATDDFFGFSLISRDRADAALAGAWSATNGKLFVAQNNDADALVAGNTDNAASDFASLDTAIYLHHDTPTEYADAAWLADRLSVDPDVQTTTWSYATLVGITPSSLTSTQQSALEAKNGNVVGRVLGVSATGKGTTGSGRNIDLMVTKFWYEARVREALAQLFLDMSALGRKVPYDESGLAMVRDRTGRVHDVALSAGHIVPNTAFTNVPDLADIPTVDRQARVLNYTFGAEPAGAIEEASVVGYVSFSLDL